MQLSAAMLAGAEMLPKTEGELFGQEDLEHGLRSCALGAVYHATFGLPDYSTSQADSDLHDAYPQLHDDHQNCPACGGFTHPDISLYSTIVHLNDDHHWERERIAAWLSSQGY
jgi:hypothetical protein